MRVVMQWIKQRFAALSARAEAGAAAVEYGLLVALIAIAIIGAVFLLGQNLKGTYNCVNNSVPTTTSISSPTGC